ncbi:MAG: ComEC/Rec2 family competence protein, partial [Candidatus Omnitrophica bacterium]|nr:ComEC/Rec2 family competence protein [Candidatus Omnitrophota bacterium]
YINITFFWCFSLAITFLALVFIFRRTEYTAAFFLGLLVFSLGAALLKDSKTLSKCHIFRHAYNRNSLPCAIKGFIDNQPLLNNNRYCFILNAEEIEYNGMKHYCAGRIFVSANTRKSLNYGEELILSGNLYRTAKRGFDKTRVYLNVKFENRIHRLNTNKGSYVKRCALWLKRYAVNAIKKHTSGAYTAVIEAMVLGEKTDIPPAIYDSMIKSGTIHILVVSGFNVGLVFFIWGLCLKLARIPRTLRLYSAVPLLILYCLVTGASTPVLRATIMGIIFILAGLIKRDPDIYNSCAIAAIFILAAAPAQLFDAGFQLSFACVVSLVWLYPKVNALLHAQEIKLRFLRYIAQALIVSFSCWLGTAGFIICYFKMVTLVSIPANLFIVPLASLITITSFCLLIAETALPYISPFIALSSELFVALLLKINVFFVHLPGAYLYLK